MADSKELENRFSWDQTWAGRQTRLDLTRRVMWRKLLERVEIGGRSYLEIGAGTGVFGRLALEAGADRVCLLDNSANALAMCRDYVGQDPRVEYVLSDATVFEADEQFDVVLSNGLIEHFLGDDQRMIVDAHVRNSRDLVVLMAPASPHFNDIRCQYPWALKRYGPQYPISVQQMARIFEGADLEPIIIERFYPLYSMKLNRMLPYQSKFLGGVDLLLTKIKLYDVLTAVTNPLGEWFGGYLIGVGRVQMAERARVASEGQD